MWDTRSHKNLWTVQTTQEQRMARGCAFMTQADEQQVIAVGDDGNIRFYNATTGRASRTIATPNAINAISTHIKKPCYATASSSVCIWDLNRNDPTTTLQWGVDTINVVQFNPTESSILASAGTDRNIVLYDIRTNKPTTKVVLKVISSRS